MSDQNLADHLAEQDEFLHHRLVTIRQDSGLTTIDVAERLGVTETSVVLFERYDVDPRLSEVRRYALAIGADITHTVTEPESLRCGCHDCWVGRRPWSERARGRIDAAMHFCADCGSNRCPKARDHRNECSEEPK